MVLRTVWRFMKSLCFLLMGRLDAARKELNKDPHVVRARYDEVLREKRKRIQRYKSSVGTLMGQRQEKIGKSRMAMEDIGRLEILKNGVLNKARSERDRMAAQGMDAEAIRTANVMVMCEADYSVFQSKIQEKRARVEELDRDVEGLTERIDSHSLQLRDLQHEIERLDGESADAVADMISAQESAAIADLLANISNDPMGQEIVELRSLRAETKAGADISARLAGTDIKVKEAEYEQLGNRESARAEFWDRMGLADGEEGPSLKQANAV